MTTNAQNSVRRSVGDTFPYVFYVALDGSGLNGIEGQAGVARFGYSLDGNQHTFSARYFEGASGGHATSINPDRSVGCLGTFSQQLVFYDPNTLEEIDRLSTLPFEDPDNTIHSTTHIAWLSVREFLAPIGRHMYLFHLDRLSKPERLAPHQVKIPHCLKVSPSKRFVCYGSIDSPTRGEAREVAIWDVQKGEARRIELPTTCWHLGMHPVQDRFYPVSYRVLPQDYRDYHQFAAAYFREYAYEIDAAEARVLRHWSVSSDTPAHLNSDITVAQNELIFGAAGSHTLVGVDLAGFAKYRIIDERPSFGEQLGAVRQIIKTSYEVFQRGSGFSNSQHIFAALRMSRFSVVDGSYATQVSKDGKLVFSAQRGLNQITVYDYPSFAIRKKVKVPSLRTFVSSKRIFSDPRLGLHHGLLLSAA